jgi:hypothetical protein
MGNTIGATLFGAAALLVMTTPSAAWDYPGHRMVGAIADFVLSSRHPEAYRKIQVLMVSKDADGHKLTRTLSQVATGSANQICRRRSRHRQKRRRANDQLRHRAVAREIAAER